MNLTYVGPDPETIVGALPLPEGWPAFDHEETDPAVAAQKLESGNYSAPVEAKPEPIRQRPLTAAPAEVPGPGATVEE